MKKILILTTSIIIAVSCANNDKPTGLLDKDKMVSMMVDIHLVEGIASSLPIPYDSSQKVYPYLEQHVFEKHGVPDSVYIQSLQYYLRDANVMEELYSRTIDSLTVKQNIGEQ